MKFIIQIFCSVTLSLVIFQDLDAQVFSELNTPFVGKWMRIEPDTILLEVVYFSADSFAFTMTSHNPDYFGFLGGSDDGLYKYAIFNDSVAYFNDAGAMSDGRPLYYEDEEPCKLIFKKTSDHTILVGEKDCYLIYGGDGIIWEGIFSKCPDSF